ncbi:alkaline phosphatase [Conexibacter sp. SYSU D00693]|uniref:alkaline phosphatase D family protein n=1 Tax=Conexibacter sp. SYSU D00693 TaxID=2812560 RepID=UPI00196A8341|nr:alkaline phosphatase D family protein [Conexibacter sp. SYSU D00693]
MADQTRLSRRHLLLAGGAGATALFLPGVQLARGASFAADPFSLGVASGDPWAHSVVLWTRLAPDPLALDGSGGMPAQAVPVRWEIAPDAGFRKVLRQGTAVARPEEAHTVHVEADGLSADREYFFRFKVGGDVSPVGRTKTAPVAGARRPMTFAFASCQNFPAGQYAAYRDMAQQELDLVVHLGDYIYEGAGGTGPRAHAPAAEIKTLSDYRVRHAQYKTDPHLQAAHAVAPWLVTWDDHEVQNNYADLEADPDSPVDVFAARRAAAYQAYWEHMPLRRAQRPVGKDLPLFRRVSYGAMATFHVLDTRQHRDDQPPACPPQESDANGGFCTEALREGRTILGADQLDWLRSGLAGSRASWDVLAQQVPVAPLDQDADPARKRFHNPDKWDGYAADRQRVTDALATVDGPVVITGDVHVNEVRDVPPSPAHLDAAPVATEFIGTSITSGGDRALSTQVDPDLANNPHRRLLDNHHGYVRCTLTARRFTADYRVVDTVLTDTAPGRTLQTWVTERGKPGAVRA